MVVVRIDLLAVKGGRDAFMVSSLLLHLANKQCEAPTEMVPCSLGAVQQSAARRYGRLLEAVQLMVRETPREILARLVVPVLTTTTPRCHSPPWRHCLLGVPVHEVHQEWVSIRRNPCSALCCCRQ
jgi:hypothetical protein